jgi:glutaredoxin
MKKKLLFLILLLLLLIPIKGLALEKNIYLFYSKDCPHCEAEIKFFDEYLKNNKEVKLIKYETAYDKKNREIFNKAYEIMDFNSNGGVPYLIIGDDVLYGYLESTGPDTIKKMIEKYVKNDEIDVFGEAMGYVEKRERKDDKKDEPKTFILPIFGEVDAREVSLPIVAIVIGFIDGFNPCAMWVLIFLISMLLGMKYRKKMWVLGLTFLFTSGFIYLLIMASWLNVAAAASKYLLFRIIIGSFAIIFGSYNIYTYIKNRKNKDVGCEVTDDKKRRKIMDRIKDIVKEKNFIIAIIGVIVLAVTINLIELACSAGLPVMFTQILAMNKLPKTLYVIYLLLYILFFMIDDIVIFAIAMKTLKIKAISNKYTKYSHLIGGIIMFIIGILMIAAPKILMFNF